MFYISIKESEGVYTDLFNRDEKGQSVILIAVSIVLVLVVALSAYNLQMLLVAKQKVRQVTDAAALAGALSRKSGLESFQQIANLDLLIALSWEIGTTWEYILEGAQYVHQVVPGYDATADLLATDHSIGNIIPVKNHIAHVDKKGIVEDSTYALAQQYLILDALLYAKAVEERNLTISTFPSENQMSLLIPSEMIINRGAVLSYTDANYASYHWKIGLKDGRMIFLVENTDELDAGAFHTSIGLACIELIHSPETLFSSMLSSLASTKTGKLVAFAYAYPYNREDVDAEFEPADSVVASLELINNENSDLIETLHQIAKKKHPSAEDIQDLKSAWDTLVADCNYMLEFCEEVRLLDVLDIGSGEYKSNPVMGSLHALNLLEQESYQDIADAKGIDYSTQTGIDSFYNTLSLEDIFGSEEAFWQDLRTTYQTLIDASTEFSSNLTHLLGVCKFFNINHASGHNVPYYFQEIPEIVYDHLESSTLNDFLTFSNMISEDIVNCYDNLAALPSMVSNAPSITVDVLMPDTEMLDYLSQIFSAPIVRWEGS